MRHGIFYIISLTVRIPHYISDNNPKDPKQIEGPKPEPPKSLMSHPDAPSVPLVLRAERPFLPRYSLPIPGSWTLCLGGELPGALGSCGEHGVAGDGQKGLAGSGWDRVRVLDCLSSWRWQVAIRPCTSGPGPSHFFPLSGLVLRVLCPCSFLFCMLDRDEGPG